MGWSSASRPRSGRHGTRTARDPTARLALAERTSETAEQAILGAQTSHVVDAGVVAKLRVVMRVEHAEPSVGDERSVRKRSLTIAHKCVTKSATPASTPTSYASRVRRSEQRWLTARRFGLTMMPTRKPLGTTKGPDQRTPSTCTYATDLCERSRWERLDSNQRRQSQRVYSPSPLTTRAHSQRSRRTGQNPNPPAAFNETAGGLDCDLGGAIAQCLSLRHRLETLQGVVLDLANPLARHTKRLPDFFERTRLLAIQPEAQLDHLTLALRTTRRGTGGDSTHGSGWSRTNVGRANGFTARPL